MDAAKVRDLQSRLMVATLRCQAMGVDVAGAYNRFVAANRATLQGANGVLMAQFRAGSGARAQVHYDRFATALANIYGDDATDRRSAPRRRRLADEAAAPRAISRRWSRCIAGSACRRRCPAPPARARRSARAGRLARVASLPSAGRWSSPARSTGWWSTSEPESAYKDIFIFAFGGGRG